MSVFSVKGLLFDLDGTLIDSVPDLAVAVDAMLGKARLPKAGEARVREWVGNGAKKLVQRALAFAKGCDESSIEDAELEKHHQQFLNDYRLASSQYSQLYEGVLPALHAWHQQGLAMALVTNKPYEFIAPLLKQFAIDQCFSVLVGGDSLPNRKPSPEPLLHACDALGLTVKDCLMIGDSRNDVEAARAAGMPVACVSYGYNHGEPIADTQPDVIVDQLTQINIVSSG